MAENNSHTLSLRKSDDTLMGAFGFPDTGNTKIIAFSSSSAAATGLVAHKWYRLIPTEDCFVHFHGSAAATTSHMFMKAGIPEVFYTGTITRVAAIRSTADGNLYLTQLQTNPQEA